MHHVPAVPENLTKLQPANGPQNLRKSVKSADLFDFRGANHAEYRSMSFSGIVVASEIDRYHHWENAPTAGPFVNLAVREGEAPAEPHARMQGEETQWTVTRTPSSAANLGPGSQGGLPTRARWRVLPPVADIPTAPDRHRTGQSRVFDQLR